jgi:hypothetical protein
MELFQRAIIAGQAAGTAGSLACEEGVAVHNLPIGELQKQLRAKGRILEEKSLTMVVGWAICIP